MRRFVGVGAVLLCAIPALRSKTLDVVSGYHVDNTGVAYANGDLQKAIDDCQPGDTLLIPAGTYLLNNGLTLKSELTVSLAAGTLLQANTVGDWAINKNPILSGRGLHHVTVEGGGKIDGGGLVYKRGKGTQPGNGIKFRDCTDVTVRNVTVRNIPTFAVDFVNSNDLTIAGLTIRGRGFDNLTGSSDGLDIEGCANVVVSDCNVEVGDDGICLKTVDGNHPCHGIKISRCTLASTCNAFKIGTGTVADVYDVLAEQIVVNKHSNPGEGNPIKSGDCIAAIAIESNDHHRTHDVICRDFTINSCYCPLFLELQNRQSYEKGDMGHLDNILIESVNCLRSAQPITFNWQCDGANKITNVTLRNVTVHNYATGPGATLSCMSGGYPDANHNGEADAYGIWARGVDGLKLQALNFSDAGGSGRRKLVFDGTVEHVDSSAIDAPPAAAH